MIAAWMLYTIAVTLILFAATSAAEYVGRALRAPTRLLWLVAMVAAVGLSVRALAIGLETAPRRAVAASTVAPTLLFGGFSVGGTASRSVVTPARSESRAQFLPAIRSVTGRVSGVAETIDVAALDHMNRALVAIWILSSFLALAWYAGSLVRLRRIERALTSTTIDGHSILLSENVGPAVLGVIRSRIVVPRWVLGLSPAERGIILAHERQHATAFDPAVIYAACCVLAFQPWNVALWPILARLRLALESDCDRRVLGRTGDEHDYGRLLIAIYERATYGPSLHIAFVERQSNLEHRIRRIARRPRLFSAGAITSTIAAAILGAAACATSSPVRHAPAPIVATPPVIPADSAPTPIVVPPVSELREKLDKLELTKEARTESWGRCSVFAFTTRLRGAGCSTNGDVIVMTFDSTHVIVSARDTADAGLAATDVLILRVRKGTVPLDFGWYAKMGRSTHTDSVLYFASPGHQTIAFRFSPAAAVREPDAQIVDVESSMSALHSNVLTWDVLPQIPTAPRCTPSIRPTPQQREQVRLGGVPIDPWTLDEPIRACILIGGTRVEFPLT